MTFDHRIDGKNANMSSANSIGFAADKSLQATNLPDPVFDYDDNDNDDGDNDNNTGNCEEAEVVIRGNISANQNYYIFTRYFNYSHYGVGNVSLNAQRSMHLPILGDSYNTIPGSNYTYGATEWVDSRFSGKSNSQFPASSLYSMPTEVVDVAEAPEKIVLHAEATTLSEITSLAASQAKEYHDLVSAMGNPSMHESTVTFSTICSVDQLSTILLESKAELDTYCATVVDNTGERWYISSTLLNKDQVYAELSKLLSEIGRTIESPINVTSMNIKFMSDSETYDILSANPNVLIVDMSKELWKANHSEANSIDILVPDYSSLVN